MTIRVVHPRIVKAAIINQSKLKERQIVPTLFKVFIAVESVILVIYHLVAIDIRKCINKSWRDRYNSSYHQIYGGENVEYKNTYKLHCLVCQWLGKKPFNVEAQRQKH